VDIARALSRIAPTHASTPARKAFESRSGASKAIAFKADAFQDDDGVIIGKVSVAGNFDRQNERVLEPALKAATWELAANPSRVGVDVNHEQQAIGCDIVGCYYSYADKACIVHLRPHDRAIYEAARDGEIIGFSWSGPYQLTEAA
jgi:hypothetical protein